MKKIILLFAGLAFLAIKNNAQTVTDIDGNKYNTITIGTQTWMKENLKVTKYLNGDVIPNVQDSTQWNNTKTGAYCSYNNSAANAKKYGYLYNWYTVDDPRKLCPTGWHVPGIGDLKDFESNLVKNGYGYQGEGTDVAQSLGAKSGWETINSSGVLGNDQTNNNSSGFTAFPGGSRYINSEFKYINNSAYWWTLSEIPPEMDEMGYLLGEETQVAIDAYNFRLTSGQPGIITEPNLKGYGFSVRCLKDTK